MLPGNAVHDMPSSRAIAFQRPRTTAIPTPVPRSMLTRQIVRGERKARSRERTPFPIVAGSLLGADWICHRRASRPAAFVQVRKASGAQVIYDG